MIPTTDNPTVAEDGPLKVATLRLTPEQQKVNRAKWAKALRSGDYLQGDSCLRNDTSGTSKYCCLGVACELAAAEGIIDPWDPEKGGYPMRGKDGKVAYHENSLLPAPLIRWLGISARGRTTNLTVDDEGNEQSATLVFYNDTEKLRFSKIADIIESGALEDWNPDYDDYTHPSSIEMDESMSDNEAI